MDKRLSRGMSRGLAVLAAALLGIGTAGCGQASAARQELRLQGIEKLESGDYSGAIADLDEALSQGKGRVSAFELDILKYRGEAEYRAEDYSAAAHTYEILMQVDEKRPEYVRLHCIASVKSGDVQTALEDFTGLYEEQKADKDADAAALTELLGDVGAALEEAGETEAAMSLYLQAETDGLADSVVYNRMGLCRMAAGEYSAALTAFDAGLACGDGRAEADLTYNRAVALEYQGNYEEALAAFEAYASKFGVDEKVQHEIDFLKTR